MMDKFLASSIVTCKRFDPKKITIKRGKLLSEDDLLPKIQGVDTAEDLQGQSGAGSGAYRRFEMTEDGISPRSRLGMDNGIFWNTGDESDETGHITEDPVLRVEMMEKRMSRLEVILDKIPAEEQAVSFGIEEITVITWGSATGPIRDAIEMLKEKDGISIGLVQVKLLHPFPTRRMAELLQLPGHAKGLAMDDSAKYDKGTAGVKTIVDIESNYSGQLGTLFEQNFNRGIDYYILKYTGRGMTCTEVYESLKRIAQGDAKKMKDGRGREVLTYGA